MLSFKVIFFLGVESFEIFMNRIYKTLLLQYTVHKKAIPFQNIVYCTEIGFLPGSFLDSNVS